MSDYEPAPLDTELLGLQHELLAFLADRGLVWFEDFSRVEADLGNAELKVYLSCSWERARGTLEAFGELHGFRRVYFSEHSGAAYLKRRAA